MTGSRLVEVNGVNIGGENHKQVGILNCDSYNTELSLVDSYTTDL